MVSIIGLNPNLARSGDLVLLAIQIGMYTKVQVWLKCIACCTVGNWKNFGWIEKNPMFKLLKDEQEEGMVVDAIVEK